MGDRTAAGFTLFELVLVVCLVGIFASVGLERMLRYQELAEKTAMERTINILRSALAMQLAARISSGGIAQTAGLAQENPMDWLAERPSNYLGALHATTDAETARGSWYFDPNSGELVYRLNLTRFFNPGPDRKDQIRFRAVVRLAPQENTQPVDDSKDLQELTIRPTRPYLWNP